MSESLNEGIAFHKSGKLDQAKNIYEKIIKQNPNNFEAINLLGIISLQLQDNDQAIILIKKAITINHKHHALYNNLGVAYKNLKKYDEAIINFNKAIELNPSYAEAYNNRADTFFLYEKYILAIEDYNKLKELKPENKYLFEISIFIIKSIICDWKDYEETLLGLKKKLINNEIYIDCINILRHFDSLNIIKNNTSTEDLRLIIKSQGELYKKNLNYKKNKKIKIGYYSADFRNHPVGHLISDLLESHNKNDFEIIGFYFNKYPDDKVTKRISKAFDKFYYTKEISDDDIILKSRKLGIDIAVDLMGITRGSKTNIFIKQLAPIQINFLGYPGTTPNNNDYIIGDKYLIPEDSQKFYFEKIIYMPDCYQPSDSKRPVFNTDYYSKEFNLAKANIKLCCLNDSSKINPLIFNAWMQILEKTKNSFLFLLESNNYCKDNLISEAKRQNVSSNRLIFLSKLPYEDHLSRFRMFDLFLDTFPYCSHTTANESLWSGVPIISLSGESFQSRVSSSLLSNLKMDELITTNIEDYKNLSISILNNPLKLKEIKSKLINNAKKSNIFNTKLYAINLEKAYKEIYNRHKNNLQPKHIYIH